MEVGSTKPGTRGLLLKVLASDLPPTVMSRDPSQPIELPKLLCNFFALDISHNLV